MIFLDYHPAAPPNTPRSANRNKAGPNNDLVSWQLKWMESYDSMQKEFKERLRKSDETSKRSTEQIKALKKKVEQTPKMVAKIVRGDKTIRKLKKKCAKNEAKFNEISVQTDAAAALVDISTQTENMNRIELAVQTDAGSPLVEIATQTEFLNTIELTLETDASTVLSKTSTQTEMVNQNAQNAVPREIAETGDYIRKFHPYARSNETSVNQKPKYVCVDCKFHTNKKSSYDDHKAENCVRKPAKNVKCPICNGLFTYRSLRHHLNYFATGKHKPNKEHAEYSQQQHLFLLEEHKRSKPKE